MNIRILGAGLAAVALLAAGCNSNTNNNNNVNTYGVGNTNTSLTQENVSQNSAGYGNEQAANTNTAAPTTPSVVNVTMNVLNSSKQSGTATLTDNGTSTTVTLNITGEPKGAIQPAHIHVGSCPGVGDVKYPLSNVVNGKSATTVKVPLATILSELPLAVNVHKSSKDLNAYMTCGQITP